MHLSSHNNQIVSASNSNSDTTKNIASNVKAYLQGLPTKGSFDGNITYTQQYKNFSASAQSSVSCRGGDSNACQVVKDNLSAPSSYSNLQRWQATARDEPDLTYFGVVELWTILKYCKNDELKKRELDTQRAFSWLVSNPQIHMTSCDIVIDAQWAEIKLKDTESDIVNVEQIDRRNANYNPTRSGITYWTTDGQRADSIRIRHVSSVDKVLHLTVALGFKSETMAVPFPSFSAMTLMDRGSNRRQSHSKLIA